MIELGEIASKLREGLGGWLGHLGQGPKPLILDDCGLRSVRGAVDRPRLRTFLSPAIGINNHIAGGMALVGCFVPMIAFQ